ncbi:MAG TPA: hypothetical protein VK996_08930 [Ramlibacter sp.]|nr:hypothetical protein [Ramlibacter sp.]
MSMNSPNDSKEEHGSEEQASAADTADTGHSGEGSASALAHMISQGLQHRRQSAEADDAAGSRHQ